MKDNKSGWQFPKALEIIKCKEGNKEFMKERPARRPFGNTVLICEYPIDDTAAEEPNAKLITWRLAKRAARDFLRVSFMPSAIVSAATDKTAKCSLYYTPETDGLSQSWDRGGAVFCNPPYGREIGKWVQKAFEEARGGIRLFYLSQRGRIRHIFTITFTGKRKSASCAGGYGSRTTTGTPPIPRPSLQW